MPHTPGEWFSDTCGEAAWVLSRQSDGREIYLADCCNEDEEFLFEPDEQTQVANMQLMAGAPKLLEALQAMFNWASKTCNPQLGDPGDCPFDQAAAAIAASGQAQELPVETFKCGVCGVHLQWETASWDGNNPYCEACFVPRPGQ